jgi:hypothetical protein
MFSKCYFHVRSPRVARLEGYKLDFNYFSKGCVSRILKIVVFAWSLPFYEELLAFLTENSRRVKLNLTLNTLNRIRVCDKRSLCRDKKGEKVK